MIQSDVTISNENLQTNLKLNEIKLELEQLRKGKRRIPDEVKHEILFYLDDLYTQDELSEIFNIEIRILRKWKRELADKLVIIEQPAEAETEIIEHAAKSKPHNDRGELGEVISFPKASRMDFKSLPEDIKELPEEVRIEENQAAKVDVSSILKSENGISFKVVISTIAIFFLLILLEYYLINEAIKFYICENSGDTLAPLKAFLGEIVPLFFSCAIASKAIKKTHSWLASIALIAFFAYSVYVVAGVKILDYQSQFSGQKVTVSKAERRESKIKYLQGQIKKYEKMGWVGRVRKYENKLEKVQDEQLTLKDSAEDQEQGLNLFKIIADSIFKLMLQVASVISASLIIINLQSRLKS